jgi:hypothetical protein
MQNSPQLRRCIAAVLAAVLFAAVGCAGTVGEIMGQRQAIYVDSKPQGAKVTYDHKPVGVTPTTISFVKGLDTVGEHVLEVTLEGYQPFVEKFIDRFSLGYSTDYPKEVFANLEPLAAGGYPPPQVAAAGVPAAAEGQTPVSPSTPVGQRWAVVVGISRYQHGGRDLPNLRYADRDAEAFYHFLLSPAGGNFPRSHVRFLENETATLAGLKDALFVFLQNAIEEDLVIIYFAGHGAPEPGNPKNLYLLTYDSDPGRLPSTSFPMWDVETALSRYIKAQRVVLIADACHSAGVSGDFATRDITVQANPINQYLTQLARSGKGRAIFTASEAGEQSEESRNWGGGHGVFTYYLLEGLRGKADANGDGIVTLGEAIDYTDEHVRRDTKSKQHPDTSGNFDRSLPLAVLR